MQRTSRPTVASGRLYTKPFHVCRAVVSSVLLQWFGCGIFKCLKLNAVDKTCKSLHRQGPVPHPRRRLGARPSSRTPRRRPRHRGRPTPNLALDLGVDLDLDLDLGSRTSFPLALQAISISTSIPKLPLPSLQPAASAGVPPAPCARALHPHPGGVPGVLGHARELDFFLIQFWA